jgi:hypothetical protein
MLPLRSSEQPGVRHKNEHHSCQKSDFWFRQERSLRCSLNDLNTIFARRGGKGANLFLFARKCVSQKWKQI